MEHKPRRPGSQQTGGISASTFSKIYWVITNHGSIPIGDIGADGGCVAAAADPHFCYAMLARRNGESLSELMGRLDRAIASAAQSSVTVDEINPPGGGSLLLKNITQNGSERTLIIRRRIHRQKLTVRGVIAVVRVQQ